MRNSFAKVVPSRLMVVGLGTTLVVLCLAAILMLLPGLIGRERLADRLVEGLQSMSTLEGDFPLDNLDRILYSIYQSNKANRNLSYLRFVDVGDGSIFTYDDKGVRKPAGRVQPEVWADLINKGKAANIESGQLDIFRLVSPEHSIGINLGIGPDVAQEIESQRRLSLVVGSIILATGIGILIMIWQTRQIEAAKGELELVLANTLEPILMVDNSCRLVFANEPARTLLGHPKGKKFRNRPLLSLIQNAENREFFSRMLSGEDKDTDMDELITNFPGFPDKVTFRAGMLNVRTEVGRTLGKLLVLRDVTLEKRLEDKKVSQTIHELKGMLGEIKGYIRQVLETMDGDADRKQRAFLNICLEKIERCYSTVATMVKSIVSAFKPQSLELRLRHCDLVDLIQTNVNDIRSSVEKEKGRGPKVTLSTSDKLPMVCCDSNAISRVLMNLLLNAVQHCPNGTVNVCVEDKGEVLQVLVKDEGSGIQKEDLERIFEPHVSFRKGGSGMGLSICRDFIRAHGGEIWADSRGKDKGSTFSFFIPKSKPAVLSSDRQFAHKLESACWRKGYYPVILEDFLAATRRIIELNPNAILLDLDMEDTISGMSLAYRLRKTGDTAKIPIIAFSANIPEARLELSRYEELSLESILPRDFKEEELDSAVGTIEAFWYLAQTL
ncbi:MAG: response regulator [Candidatus Abyssobacteria bacterium SURF_5]|uniref:histidine kinase n=1 Tax=Abyssobacteria bacterium (strain SURF_5) TaxID=2093360 RepID=A0A3A4NQM0_ABYX5|nr:MAG: response regulator [Candidatus Abyssubacteria bacterium SURF_5]